MVVLYLGPSLLYRTLGLAGYFFGEVLRSTFREDQMRALLGKFGFEATEDRDLDSIIRDLVDDPGGIPRAAKHLRVVSAVCK
jgi:hypothetical protein